MSESVARQTWDAQDYAKNARFVAEMGVPVLDLLAPRSDERILDVGCGDGALTLAIAQRGADVVGVDSSPELIAAARTAGLDARLIDARELPFESEFDAVFSNAALHWIREPDRVLRGVKQALRPGGRFVAEFGGHGNVAAIRTALAAVLGARGRAVPALWYFPTAEEYAACLEAAGFRVDDIGLIPRPTLLPTGLEAWLNTFGRSYLADFDEGGRREALDAVTGLLEPILRDAAGRWIADYVRLRFKATAI